MIPFDNGDLLRIPTEYEIFGENEYGEQEPDWVEQFEYTKKRRGRIALAGLNGGLQYYWLLVSRKLLDYWQHMPVKVQEKKYLLLKHSLKEVLQIV